MKHIKLFLNNSKKPITIIASDGDPVMVKHQIANLILHYADMVTDLTKIRVVIE